jgi:DNA-binding LacI/PurR family transcriptional regulator
LVSVDAGIKSTRVATLAVDYHRGVRQAVQHLAGLGHRNMAFISGPMHLHSSKARQLAFLESMREIGAPVKRSWLPEGNHRLEGGTACMKSILETGDVPTAVLCSNDVTAIGVLHALAASGLRVPQDMSVVGFDDIHMARFTVPPLTTIRMSPDDLASAAVESLIAQAGAGDNESIGVPNEIKTNLVVRQTTNFRDKSMQAFAPSH